MIDWLTAQFNQFSVLWLLLSSIAGGIIGASIKFVFDFMLPESLRARREILAVKNKYAIPIFYAAVELRRRLDNILKLIHLIENETGWLRKEDKEDYYFVSTLYLTAQFLGWVQVLRRTVVYLDLTTTGETKAYAYGLEAVMSSFSDPALMQEKAASDPLKTEDKWVYSIWLQAIGQQMIVKEGDDYRVMDFATFYGKVKAEGESEFKRWIAPLSDFYNGLNSKQIRFRRIAAIHSILNAFIELNDPKYLKSKRWVYYWDLLRPEEQTCVEEVIRGFTPQFKAGKT